ncbi:MAG TPA: hypothetical protein VGI28_10325 [Stellaceae bacterium]
MVKLLANVGEQMRTTTRVYGYDKLPIVERIKRGETTVEEEAAKLEPSGTVEEILEWLRLYEAEGRDAFIKRKSGTGARRDVRSTKTRSKQ